jgi:hypothetical protein
VLKMLEEFVLSKQGIPFRVSVENVKGEWHPDKTVEQDRSGITGVGCTNVQRTVGLQTANVVGRGYKSTVGADDITMRNAAN